MLFIVFILKKNVFMYIKHLFTLYVLICIGCKNNINKICISNSMIMIITLQIYINMYPMHRYKHYAYLSLRTLIFMYVF